MGMNCPQAAVLFLVLTVFSFFNYICGSVDKGL